MHAALVELAVQTATHVACLHKQGKQGWNQMPTCLAQLISTTTNRQTMHDLLQKSVELLVQTPFTQTRTVKASAAPQSGGVKAVAILNMLSRACGANPLTINVMEHFLSWTVEKKLLRPSQVPYEIRIHVAAINAQDNLEIIDTTIRPKGGTAPTPDKKLVLEGTHFYTATATPFTNPLQPTRVSTQDLRDAVGYGLGRTDKDFWAFKEGELSCALKTIMHGRVGE